MSEKTEQFKITESSEPIKGFIYNFNSQSSLLHAIL